MLLHIFNIFLLWIELCPLTLHQVHMLRSSSVPQNEALFGELVFTEVIK
jgi:hypothetical protein